MLNFNWTRQVVITKGVFDNIVLVRLFVFFKNVYEEKKCIKKCVILFKGKTVGIFTLFNGA